MNNSEALKKLKETHESIKAIQNSLLNTAMTELDKTEEGKMKNFLESSLDSASNGNLSFEEFNKGFINELNKEQDGR